MDRRGLNGGNSRFPRLPLSKAYCKKIDNLLERAIQFMKS